LKTTTARTYAALSATNEAILQDLPKICIGKYVSRLFRW
jgi:hypothetical protein